MNLKSVCHNFPYLISKRHCFPDAFLSLPSILLPFAPTRRRFRLAFFQTNALSPVCGISHLKKAFKVLNLHLLFQVFFVPMLFILCSLPVINAFAANVTFKWDANGEADLAGYKIYYGTSSGNYTNSVDVGNTTSYTQTGL